MTTYRKSMREALNEVYLGEDNMDLLKKAAGGSAQKLKMKDGKVTMDSFTASAIMQVYKAINPKNKKTMENVVNTGTITSLQKLQSLAMRAIKSGDEVEHDGEELDEAKYDLYHKDFSSAMQHAYAMAKKLHGITIDPKEIDDKVATGPSKPGSGKTNKYRLKGDKGAIQVQVYNKGGSKPFELNMYKEEVELGESVSVKDFDSLKKGDTVTIQSKSVMGGSKEGTYKVTGKNVVGKAKVEKVTLKNVKNPGGVKYFLYKRDDKVSFAQGDMGASVVSFKKEEVELDEKLKYEGKFKKGDTIKSFDFRGKKDRYISGKITGMEMRQGAKVYVIKITNDSGKTSGGRVGDTGYVPMQTSMDWDGRIVKEEVELDENKGLENKSKKSGVSVGILKKVYSRGLAAYKTGHRPGTTAPQWAMARVNSFLTGGGARKADADLWKQAKGQKEEVELDEASARADAMRAMRRGKKVDPADVDTDASDDDVKAASKNIIMQLRKSVSLRGNFPVEFMDKKKVKVDAKIASAVQDKYNSMRKADDKEKFQAKIAKSYKDMLSALKEGFASDAQRRAAFASGYKEKGKKKKEDIGEDITVTAATDGGISQRDLDHVQKELRKLGIKDAVVDQNEMDKNKIDVKTKMSDDKVKKAFNKSKMTVNYEHVQMEGTWALPDTPKLKAGLKKLMMKKIPLGKDGETAIDKIGEYIGDDELYDDLYTASKKNGPKGDARPIIRGWMDRNFVDSWEKYRIETITILNRIDQKIQERKNG